MAAGPHAGPDRATIGAFVGVVIIGGLNAIAVKRSVAELDPYWSAATRFLVAALLLAALVVVMRRPFPRGGSLGGALLYGVVAFAGSFGFVYPALGQIPAATGVVFLALVPLETFGLAILHRQERFQVRGLVGAVIALAGVAVVVADQLSVDIPLGAMLMMLAGTVFIAEGAVVLKWVPRSDPFGTNAVAMAGAGVVLLGLSLLAGDTWIMPVQADTWLAMAYLVVLGSVVLFALYVFALRRWTASAVSYTTLLMPLVGIPVAAWLLGEQVTLAFVGGGVLSIIGVYVGAFMQARPRAVSVTSSPECLPIDNCGPPPRPARQVQTGSG
jgi:drug/metabolite transporter (DMT)-like permease